MSTTYVCDHAAADHELIATVSRLSGALVEAVGTHERVFHDGQACADLRLSIVGTLLYRIGLDMTSPNTFLAIGLAAVKAAVVGGEQCGCDACRGKRS